MSILTFTLACAMAFSPVAVQEICLEEQQVKFSEAIYIDGEWYVALVCEPIYTFTERCVLCQKISDKITQKTGKKSNVVIDSGLYFDVKYAKSEQNCPELLKRIKTYFLRRNYEYQRNN